MHSWQGCTNTSTITHARTRPDGVYFCLHDKIVKHPSSHVFDHGCNINTAVNSLHVKNMSLKLFTIITNREFV